ncbi:acyltransferase [Terrabacter sp. NPDC080008]|uniref:acyltransferase family protein n=1 Tax=Terrabacter sp. NPDC080008 TaxID=3155176 RepID=UPI003450658D
MGDARDAVGPAGAGRIGSIDGLRAAAFLAVFAFHTWEFAGHPSIPVVSFVIGQNIRPDFFVVLTGFVLFLPFARDERRLGRLAAGPWLRRRLRRIVVPYYVALAFAVLLPQALVALTRLAGRPSSWQPVPGLGAWVSHLTFTHLLFRDWWGSINGSLWTMSLEMQLYLLFPLLVLAVSRWGLRALAGAVVVSVLFRIGVALVVAGPAFPDQFPWAASGLGRLMELAAGMAAAEVVFRHGWRPRRSATAALVLAMGGLFTLASWAAATDPVVPVRELALGGLFGSLVVLASTVGAVTRLFAWRPLAVLGLRAYSLFLVHQPLAWYVSRGLRTFAGVDDGPLMLLLLWSVGLAVVLAVGLVFFRVVERPCIAWAKRLPVTAAPATGAQDESVLGGSGAAPVSDPAH